MTDANPSQQLFDMWKRQLEEGAQAWSRLLGQSPAAPPDPTALWRPVMEQWTQAWSRAFAQTPATPEVMAQYKQFLDQSIEAWSRALGQAMNTEGFARLLSQYLDQFLVSYGPIKKSTEQSVDTALKSLNVASRGQVTAVARQIVELEERIEHLEDMLGQALRRLEPAGTTPVASGQERA